MLYFKSSCTSNSSLGQLYITGGGSGTSGIQAALSQLVPTEKMDPFAGLASNPKIFSDDYLAQIRDFSAVSVGLGLRKIGDT